MIEMDNTKKEKIGKWTKLLIWLGVSAYKIKYGYNKQKTISVGWRF